MSTIAEWDHSCLRIHLNKAKRQTYISMMRKAYVIYGFNIWIFQVYLTSFLRHHQSEYFRCAALSDIQHLSHAKQDQIYTSCICNNAANLTTMCCGQLIAGKKTKSSRFRVVFSSIDRLQCHNLHVFWLYVNPAPRFIDSTAWHPFIVQHVEEHG